MSDAIISVENLGKRYSLRHQTGERYTALRDVIADKAKSLFRRNGRSRAFTDFSVSASQHVSVSPAPPAREEFWALRHVGFEVQQGEVVGIIGRNGAGKSTLLKILSRITQPTEGRIRIRGRVASLLEVGTGFHPELTGRENIFLNGAILGMSRAEIRTKFDEIVAFAETEKFLDTPVKHYSSGMYVRLAFAVAAHLEPEILVVDEVLAVGDAQFQQKCIEKMRSIASGDGKTVLLVSHQLKTVEQLCSRALLLSQGKLIRNSSAREVISLYLEESSSHLGERVDYELSNELSIAQLVVEPDVIHSFKLMSISLVLRAHAACRLYDVQLLISDSADYRLALLDLRQRYHPYEIKAGTDLAFAVTLPSLHLTEGTYRVGCCVRTARNFGTYDDIVRFEVAPVPVVDGLIPYAVEYLGPLQIEYEFSCRVSDSIRVRQ